MNDFTGGALQLLPKIYDDLAQPSVQKVGKALGTVFEFSTLPFLYVQSLNDKVKLNIKRNLDSYKSKLDAIPEENLCEVNPQIGIPLLERLTYTTNEEIADLFTSLLTKASSTETVNEAHPAFIQIIERLSVDEARIINELSGKREIPYINIRLKLEENHYRYFERFYTRLDETIKLIAPDNIVLYLENLVSAGIFLDREARYSIDQYGEYANLCMKYDYEEKKDFYTSLNQALEIEQNFFEITEFGLKFIEACTESHIH